MPVAEAEDALAALMQAFFAAVSFDAGGTPGYERIAGLFAGGGQLIDNTGGAPAIATVAEFVAPRRRAVEAGELTEFLEVEESAATEAFGGVAHGWSPSPRRGGGGGEPFAGRGAIATQFVLTPEGWRISSMAWDD